MSFVVNLDPYKDAVQKDVLKHLKEFYQDAYDEVAGDTPVDTGRAQSSWWIVPPGKMSNVVEGQGVRRAPSLYWMTWENASADIVNPNDYVVYLNEGWSSQAPSKFVESAIARAVRNAA